MKIQDITSLLETIAPLSFQEDYDNAGLITGDADWECTGVIVSLDVIENVVEEAIEKNCNLIVAHHPIIFRGLKKITGKNYVEKTIITAIKNDIAIYAIHTNLDNIKPGVNKKMAERLDLQNIQILQPKHGLLKKLVVFAPIDYAEKVKNALFDAGAGNIGKYSDCSFISEGKGTFKPGKEADPFVGEIGIRHLETETKIEVIFPSYLEQKIIASMIEAHPYEEVAYEIYSLDNSLQDVGSGMIGDLPFAVAEVQFLKDVQKHFGLQVIRHTTLLNNEVSRIALCGGAGIFLLSAALSAKADAFITSDIKYHEFFDAEGKILLADIGHYESEQYTIDLLFDILRQNFPNFAVLKTGINTNPVHYFKG